MIDNNIIDKLRKLNSKSNKQLKLNNKFICSFDIPTNITTNQLHYFFTEFVKDSNCPCMISYANVSVYDVEQSKIRHGKIFLQYNADLGKNNEYSIMLKIIDKANRTNTMFTIVDCEIEDKKEIES